MYSTTQQNFQRWIDTQKCKKKFPCRWAFSQEGCAPKEASQNQTVPVSFFVENFLYIHQKKIPTSYLFSMLQHNWMIQAPQSRSDFFFFLMLCFSVFYVFFSCPSFWTKRRISDNFLPIDLRTRSSQLQQEPSKLAGFTCRVTRRRAKSGIPDWWLLVAELPAALW